MLVFFYKHFCFSCVRKVGTGCGHFSLSSFLHQLPIKGAPPIYWTLMATLGTVQQIQANTVWNNTKPLWLVVILTILVVMVMKSTMTITLKQCKEVELCLPRWRKDGEAPTWTTEASKCRSPATEFAFIFASIDRSKLSTSSKFS